ncbi:MAG TPA: hypothetical protein VFJ53_09090 [Solirubrobacterales bacterium]|nr:hypothetical protein [Solirubrobacterales bacterium]
MKIEKRFSGGRQTLVKKVEGPMACAGGLILLAAVAYGVADIVLTPTPVSGQAGFEDLVLGSSTVVIAVRVAAIFAAAFFVVSVVALVVRRQWLVRVGPVEVLDQVADLDLEKRRVEESLENAMQTIDSLRYELVLSDLLLNRAVSESEKDR